jgi:rhodanese-related sulfurtransferase
MKLPEKNHTVLVTALVLIGGVLPIFLHWLGTGRVPSVSVSEAKARLARPGSSAMLVDVRAPEAYAAGHAPGARIWPYGALAAATNASQLPAEMANSQLLVICESGYLSAAAVRKLQALGITNVHNVAGGMEAWQAQTPAQPDELRPISALEQWLAVLTAFGVKPAYMLLSLVLIIVLWRSAGPDLASLRWGLIGFLGGEAFCAVNYLGCSGQSALMEYLHSYGMVLSFGFTAYAAFEGLDRRLLRYSDPDARCAGLSLCLKCIKYTTAPCGFQRMFLLLIPATLVMAFMPLCVRLKAVSYWTCILGTVFQCSHPLSSQWVEVRYCALAAVALIAAAWAVLLAKGVLGIPLSKVLFAAGLGPLGFGMLRMVLFTAYADNQVWLNVWEEVTELLFIAGVAFAL